MNQDRLFKYNLLPLPVRILNALDRFLRFFGIRIIKLSERKLLRLAVAKARLSPVAEKYDFEEPLHHLITSIEKDSRLNYFGYKVIDSKLRNTITFRLVVDDYIRRYPEILEEKIEQPLFIMALPRTGTSFIQSILSQDPSSRWLQPWEALFWPPREPHLRRDPRYFTDDRRIKHTVAYYEWLNPRLPYLNVVHPSTGLQPEECYSLLEKSFLSHSFILYSYVPDYIRWINDLSLQSWVAAYQLHKRQLQFLQWWYPRKRWVLKSPLHSFNLNALFTVYPDACIVQPHRNPVESVPSFCGLIATLNSIHTNDVQFSGIGTLCSEIIAEAARRIMNFRTDFNRSRFFDVDYFEMVRNPFHTVTRIYKHFGYALCDETAEAMKRFITENPKDKFGAHLYTLEEFGLSRESLEGAFQNYVEWYRERIKELR